jgi:hypothetical protein
VIAETRSIRLPRVRANLNPAERGAAGFFSSLPLEEIACADAASFFAICERGAREGGESGADFGERGLIAGGSGSPNSKRKGPRKTGACFA